MSTKHSPSPRVAARCSKQLKKRITDAMRSTGQEESEIVRVALEQFFAAHRKPQEIIAAVIASRCAGLSA